MEFDFLWFFIWLLAVVGATHIVTGASLFGGFRRWLFRMEDKHPNSAIASSAKSLFTCNQCLGFWVGALWSVWFLPLGDAPFYVNLLILGPVGSLAADVAYRVKSWLCEEC